MKQGWEIKKLSEVAIKIFAGGDKPQLFSEYKTNELNIPVFANGISKDGLVGYTDNAIVNQECITISARGTIGYCCVRKTPFVPIVRLITIIPNNEINTKFLYYAISNINFENNGVAIPQLTIPMLKGVSLSLPPLPEQEKIVAELDCLSGIIEKKKQQLKEYDALAQSIFYEMFGNPIDNEKVWEYEKLSNKAEISSSKRIFASEYSDSGIPFYRGKEVTEKSKGNPISVELFISQERFEEIKLKYGIPAIGDILVTAVGTIGNIWVVDSDEPFYFKDGNVLWLKIKDDTNPIYFKYILTILIDEYKEMIANGCAYSALTIANLKDMPTCITPLALQQEFASKIEAIEKQKELIKQSIAETETLL